MKKIVFIIASLLLLASCGKEEAAPDITLEAYTGETESYAEEPETESSSLLDYEYLKSVEVYNEDVIVTTYAFPESSFGSGTDSVVSHINGVTLRTTLLKGTPEAVVKDAADTRRKALKQDNRNSSINVTEGAVTTIDYETRVSGETYPKRIYISAEHVTDDYSLLTVIDIDTSSLTEESMPAIEELATIFPMS